MSLAQVVFPATTTQHGRCAEGAPSTLLIERPRVAVTRRWGRQWVGPFLLGVLSLGCKTQSPPLTNPFMAAESVAPPSTRTPPPGAAQPYYPGDPTPGAPGAGPPPTTAPAGVPGGWAPTSPTPPFGGSGASVPPAAPLNTAPPPVAPAAPGQFSPQADWSAADSGATFASAPQGVPNTTAAPLNEVVQAAWQSPTSGAVQGQVATLSPAGLPLAPQRAPGDGSASTVTWGPTVGGEVRPAAASYDLAQRYGVDEHYRSLRGQVLRDAAGNLAIRYQASEGPVDPFGGQLSLANPEVLAGVPAGQFVAVQGQVVAARTDGAAPSFRVDALQQQR